MTLAPDKIGDNGQRFVVQTFGWPRPALEWQNAAYMATDDRADKIVASFRRCPGCKDARVVDRQKEGQ